MKPDKSPKAPTPSIHEGDGGEIRFSHTKPNRLGKELGRQKDPQSDRSGLEEGSKGMSSTPDTPGRAKSASSRQQTHPGQTSQTGSDELDGAKS
jgi:hypothetical protein